jgi:hypothetical protein
LIDKEIITIVEDGLNGTSITGVTEWYYATATDNEKLPELTEEDPEGEGYKWKNIVSSTGYGPDLPYLWNIEIVTLSIGEPISNDPALIAYYAEDGGDGRGIKNITPYYAIGNSSTSAPDGGPIIDEEGKIKVAENWTTDYQGQISAG